MDFRRDSLHLLDQWGVTEINTKNSINVKESSYTWNIKNFTFATDSVYYQSPSFVINQKNMIKWYLDFYINGADDEDEDNITISFNADSIPNDDCTFDIKFTFAILDKDGKKHFEKTEHQKFSQTNCYGENINFVKKADIVDDEKLLLNDALTIRCDYVAKSSCKHSSFLCCDKRDELNKTVLDDFEKLFEAQEFGYVTLKASSCSKTLKAHKTILSARSPVFRAMFNTDMVENKDNVVNIDDIDYNVLKELLRFFYAARVENLENLVVGILDAAEKYQVESLKDICEDHLRSNVKIDNVVEAFILCSRYKMENLKNQVTHLMKMYAEDIVQTDGFKYLKDSNLLVEIINILVKR